jgi:hypothetical protein
LQMSFSAVGAPGGGGPKRDAGAVAKSAAADRRHQPRAGGPAQVARKNSLPAGSDGGAGHWSIATTLIAEARRNGVEPVAVLTDVPKRIVAL